MEMELPPVERPAKQEKIMSLQSIVIRRMHLDDRGLPLQLEEAVTKEEAKQAAREEAKLRLKTGEEEEEVEGGGEQRRAPPSPLAQLSVHVVEAVRPHTFQPFLLQEEHFLYVNVSISKELRAGTSARTAISEVQPNVSFQPVKVEVFTLPAEVVLELVMWAGGKAKPKKVGTASVFVTAGMSCSATSVGGLKPLALEALSY